MKHLSSHRVRVFQIKHAIVVFQNFYSHSLLLFFFFFLSLFENAKNRRDVRFESRNEFNHILILPSERVHSNRFSTSPITQLIFSSTGVDEQKINSAQFQYEKKNQFNLHKCRRQSQSDDSNRCVLKWPKTSRPFHHSHVCVYCEYLRISFVYSFILGNKWTKQKKKKKQDSHLLSTTMHTHAMAYVPT